MNRPLFYSLIGIGTGTLIGTILFLVWYSTTPLQQEDLGKPIQAPTITESEPTTTRDAVTSITIKDLTLKELEKNKELEVIINAHECKFLQPSDMVECAQVTCTLLDHKVPSALLKTDKAFINRAKKNIFFSGSVFGTVKDIVIQGNDINYNFSQQILYTDKTTTYHHPDFSIHAKKSFIDIKNNRIELFDGVINEFIIRP